MALCCLTVAAVELAAAQQQQRPAAQALGQAGQRTGVKTIASSQGPFCRPAQQPLLRFTHSPYKPYKPTVGSVCRSFSPLQGPAAGLRSKLQAGPLLHSAAASYSAASGWQLSAKRWAAGRRWGGGWAGVFCTLFSVVFPCDRMGQFVKGCWTTHVFPCTS